MPQRKELPSRREPLREQLSPEELKRPEHISAIRAYSPVLATELKKHPIESVEMVRAALEATGLPQVRKKLAGSEELAGAERARELAVALKNSVGDTLTRYKLRYVMPAVLETAKAKKHSPAAVVDAFHENIKARVIVGDNLVHLMPIIVRMAEQGSDTATLTNRLAALAHDGIEENQMQEISELLTEVAKYGIDAGQAAGFYHASLKRGVLTPKQLPAAGRQLNNLLSKMMSTEKASGFYAYLHGAIKEKEITNLRQLQLVVNAALYCATEKPGWTFETLMQHAKSAQEKIGDFEETLELQRMMLQRKLFPSSRLLVRLWQAPAT